MYSEVDEGPMHFFIRRCALLQNSGFKPDAQIVGDKSNICPQHKNFHFLCTLTDNIKKA